MLQQEELKLKAGDLARKWKKDQDDADLKEMKIAIDAQRSGVMGRAQELQMQQRDRDTADKTFMELLKLFHANKAGSSGQPGQPGQPDQGPPPQ
jgi:hypothetical protein